MTDVRELIERLREHATDWDGRQMPDIEPAKGDPTAGTLRQAANALAAALEREEALREALAAKFAVTDAMEKAGVNHALHDSVSGASGGWPGYVRRLWGAMNMARISDSSPENTNGN